MPDYSKSIIYTIRSRDSVYVGSTIDFRSRKYKHKSCIYNENRKHYNTNLYKTIREKILASGICNHTQNIHVKTNLNS